MKRYLWIILAARGLAVAQAPADLATPTLGYVYDSEAQSLRALEGVPGAAVLGDALHLDSPFDAIAVSPDRRYALGTRSGESKQALIRLDGKTALALPSDLPAGRTFYSPSGTTLALMTAGAVEVWGGLPDGPHRLRTVPADLVAEIDRLAVSDDGGAVVALAGGTLWSLGDSASPLGDGYRDMQFLRTSQDLAALGENRLMLFRKASAESMEDLLGIETANASAFAFSRDENTVALLGDGSVSLVQRDSGTVTLLNLDEIEAIGLMRLEGNAVFQLAVADGIWLVDGDSSSPRLIAVDMPAGEGVAQ